MKGTSVKISLPKWGPGDGPTKQSVNRVPPIGRTSESRPLATQVTVKSYHSTISPEEAAAAGVEDGGLGVLDREVSGQNAHPHFLDALTARHGVARDIIGHIFREEYQAIVFVLSVLRPKIKVSKERALSAIDAHTSALKQQMIVQAKFEAAGSPRVTKHNRWLLGVSYLALFAGDWSLIAVGFEIFGLSDKPWILGIGFTDDLHLAAISSVSALIVLGHFSAAPLRRIEHALRLRHSADKQDLTGRRWPAPFDWVWLFVLLGLASCALYALSNIRTDYLVSQGIPANGATFLLLQVGIFSGALALGFVHQPAPDAFEWKGKVDAADEAVETTGAVQRECLDDYTDQTGEYNGEAAHLGAVLAQSGHHVEADRNDKSVIGRDYYLRRYLNSQPGDQIAQENILADGYEELPEYSQDDLRKALTGATPLPLFPLLSTRSVEQHLANRRAEVDRLRVRIDQKGIEALDLPEYEKPEDETVDSDELIEDTGGEDTADSAVEEEDPENEAKRSRLFPVQTNDEDVVDAEVIDIDEDEESA